MEYGSLQSRCLHISSALLAFMHWDLQKREQDLCSIEPYRAISWIKNTGWLNGHSNSIPAMLAACESIWILLNFAVLRLTKCGFADALLALSRHGNAGNLAQLAVLVESPFCDLAHLYIINCTIIIIINYYCYYYYYYYIDITQISYIYIYILI